MSDEHNDIGTQDKHAIDPGLAGIIEDVLDQRDIAMRESVKSTLAALAQPNRAAHADILDAAAGNQEQESVAAEEGQRKQRTVVSRHQPTDMLYRNLFRKNPALSDCRSPEMDHWNHQWLIGILNHDRAQQRLAFDKANAAYRRNIRANTRATTLEGALDATDPTAILAGTGGSLLPQPFTQVVMIAKEASAVIGMLAQVYPMTSATLRIPTAGTATAAKRAEGNAVAQGEPSYASKMLRAEAMTCFMKSSREFLVDSPFNAVELFGTRAGMAIGAAEDVDFCTSNGTHPNASEAIVGGNVDEATTTVLTYPDLAKLYRAVGKAYRGRGSAWLGNSVTLGLLDVLLDGDGRPILNNPQQNVAPIGDSPGNEGFVFRHPVYEVPLADGQLIFGNILAGYAIGRREGISVRMSEQAEFSAGIVQFMIEERYDAVVQDAGALKQMSALATVA